MNPIIASSCANGATRRLLPNPPRPPVRSLPATNPEACITSDGVQRLSAQISRSLPRRLCPSLCAPVVRRTPAEGPPSRHATWAALSSVVRKVESISPSSVMPAALAPDHWMGVLVTCWTTLRAVLTHVLSAPGVIGAGKASCQGPVAAEGGRGWHRSAAARAQREDPHTGPAAPAGGRSSQPAERLPAFLEVSIDLTLLAQPAWCGAQLLAAHLLLATHRMHQTLEPDGTGRLGFGHFVKYRTGS